MKTGLSHSSSGDRCLRMAHTSILLSILSLHKQFTSPLVSSDELPIGNINPKKIFYMYDKCVGTKMTLLIFTSSPLASKSGDWGTEGSEFLDEQKTSRKSRNES
ncbi:unnamed protein product [Cuscuta epithymum]|uniref:Uncharacterized protein n=1 Tax=Cuscuta epithymum TaxID=186058 RepID=A0AAV0FGC8_9ASTE|nr:unnamed protein product [Cuscuta epithymum]